VKSVILFGGGDGGGLILTDNGVRPIPPFDPDVLLTLKATAAMVKSLSSSRDDSRGKKAKLAAGLANLAISQVEEVVGPLDGPNAVIYQDDDGGFTCGSTGRPPLPFPWPPSPLPTLPQLMSAGFVEIDLVELLRRAKVSNVAYADVFERPKVVAKELGAKISDKTAKDLRLLAPSRAAAIKNPVDREIVTFFHEVVKDGRYVGTWLSRPFEVSQVLKIQLSEAALEQILTSGAAVSFGFRGDGNQVADIGVCVAVAIAVDIVVIAIVAIASDEKSLEDIIKDRSGIAKI
jgi:hypothetical protein